jgi:hypothetical protein
METINKPEMTTNTPTSVKSEFQEFYDTFIERYAFQVPYDGSNNFYDQKILDDVKLRESLKKTFNEYNNYVQSVIKQLIEVNAFNMGFDSWTKEEKELRKVKEGEQFIDWFIRYKNTTTTNENGK